MSIRTGNPYRYQGQSADVESIPNRGDTETACDILVTNRGSGAAVDLPVFPTLDRRPDWLDDAFIVAWFAYQEDRQGRLVPGARRDIQVSFQRSWGNGTSQRLSGLAEKRFLRTLKPANEAHAYEYGLHPDIPAAEVERWIALGRMLFEREKGLVGRTLASPLIKHGALKMAGVLVLAVVHRYGPISPALLARTLEPLMHRQTVTNKWQKLIEIGAIETSDECLRLRSDWSESLAGYVRVNGFDSWSEALSGRIEGERLRYHANQTGPVVMRIRLAIIRSMPCEVCGLADGAGEPDHFPPKRWGGFDHPDLLYPMCRRHNIELGIMVRDLPGPILRPRVLSVGSVGPLPEWLVEARRLSIEALRLRDAGLLEQSQRLVEGSFLGWCAKGLGSNSVVFERIDEVGGRRVGRRTFLGGSPERLSG